MPAVPEFWDANDDWVPDDGHVLIDAEGSGWTQTKLDRLNGAAAEWTSNSRFDPGRTVTGSHDYYVDGTVPACTGYWDPSWLQVTCPTRQARYFTQDPTEIHHWRLTSKDTYTNIADWTWWYGSTHTGQSGVPDFQGVVTHEIGHWVYLIDLPTNQCTAGTGIETMCGGPIGPIDDDTWRIRSLTSDDIAAANAVYP